MYGKGRGREERTAFIWTRILKPDFGIVGDPEKSVLTVMCVSSGAKCGHRKCRTRCHGCLEDGVGNLTAITTR